MFFRSPEPDLSKYYTLATYASGRGRAGGILSFRNSHAHSDILRTWWMRDSSTGTLRAASPFAASVADGDAFCLRGFTNCSQSRYGGVWSPRLPRSSFPATLLFSRSPGDFALETQAGAAAAGAPSLRGRCGEREILAASTEEAASLKGKQAEGPEKLTLGFLHAPPLSHGRAAPSVGPRATVFLRKPQRQDFPQVSVSAWGARCQLQTCGASGPPSHYAVTKTLLCNSGRTPGSLLSAYEPAP